jgi:NAD(P)-dependent dehydrogenase (short-subunit alcohol dehydrogenase family)
MSKVWFITGASRGFGALMAKDALARGDSVVATARNPQSVIDALGEHPALLALRLDVTQEAAAVLAARAAVDRFGRIDVLVNNAGYGLLGAVEEASAEEVRALYDTNVFGLLNVTRAVLPQLRKQGSGRVINMSSVGGYQAAAGWGVYGSTKFAVEGISEALAEEVRPLGIQVTVVEPGYFRTEFLEGNSLVSTGEQLADYAGTVGAMRTLAASISLKQPGDPRKLSLAMLQLADAAQPPVRLLLGSDTVRMVREKNRFVEQELGEWIGLSLSTDHDDVLQQAA